MRSYVFAGILAALSVSVGAPALHAQWPGTLRVDLVDSNGRPLAATLRIPAARRTASSDSTTGRIILAGLAPGTWEAQIVVGDSIVERLRIEIAPLRVTDLGEIRPGFGAERCSYRGMFREPWSMTRISANGVRGADGVFEVEMGCDASGPGEERVR